MRGSSAMRRSSATRATSNITHRVRGGCLTAFVQADGTILFNRGCFSGTDAEFLEAVEQKHGDGPCAIEYRAAVELIKLRLSRVKQVK